jgi:hypothetical protein
VDGNAAGSANVAAMADHTAAAWSATVTALNLTNGDAFTWTNTGAARRQAGASTVSIYAAGWASNGSLFSGSAPSTPTLAADTTHGGFNFGFTPPAANTARWMVAVWLRLVVAGVPAT